MHAYAIAWFLLFVQLHLIENFQYEWWASVCRCINSHAFRNDLMDHLIHRQCSIWTLFSLSVSLFSCLVSLKHGCCFVISGFAYFYTKIKFKIIRSCQRRTTTTTCPCYKFIRPSNQYFMWANGSGIQFTSSTNNNTNSISIVWFLLVLPSRMGDCTLLSAIFQFEHIDGVHPDAEHCTAFINNKTQNRHMIWIKSICIGDDVFLNMHIDLNCLSLAISKRWSSTTEGTMVYITWCREPIPPDNDFPRDC